MTIDTCISQAKSLPPEDQLALVQRLWDTIAADESNVPVTDAQRAELDRRVAELDADEQSDRPIGDEWGKVRRRITGQ